MTGENGNIIKKTEKNIQKLYFCYDFKSYIKAYLNYNDFQFSNSHHILNGGKKTQMGDKSVTWNQKDLNSTAPKIL